MISSRRCRPRRRRTCRRWAGRTTSGRGCASPGRRPRGARPGRPRTGCRAGPGSPDAARRAQPEPRWQPPSPRRARKPIPRGAMPDATAKWPFAGGLSAGDGRALAGLERLPMASRARSVTSMRILAVAPTPCLMARRAFEPSGTFMRTRLLAGPSVLTRRRRIGALADVQAPADDDRAVLAAAHVGDRAAQAQQALAALRLRAQRRRDPCRAPTAGCRRRCAGSCRAATPGSGRRPRGRPACRRRRSRGRACRPSRTGAGRRCGSGPGRAGS